MFDLIVRYLNLIDTFLVTPSPTRAIVFALLFSWGLTHGVRFYTLRKLDETVAKSLEEVVSFLSCFVPCLILWPSWKFNLTAFLAAAIVALWSPYAYKRVGDLIAHYLPWLDPTPKPKDPPTVTTPAPLNQDKQN